MIIDSLTYQYFYTPKTLFIRLKLFTEISLKKMYVQDATSYMTPSNFDVYMNNN
jgi:hypothetical protein